MIGVRKFDMKKKSIVFFGIVCLCIILFIIGVNLDRNNINSLPETNLELNKLVNNGYEIDGSHYLNIVGDANLTYEDIDTYIQCISIMLAKEAEEDIHVQVYYSNGDHGYNEITSKSGIIAKGDKKVCISMGNEVADLRLDITYNQGNAFDLDEIIINETSQVRADTNAVLFKKYMYSGVILIIVIAFLSIFVYKLKEEYIYVTMGMLIGLIYLVSITPLSPPDEAHHYQTAYKLSNVLMLKWNSIDYGNETDFQYDGFVGHKNVKTGYSRLLEDGFKVQKNQGKQITIPKPNNLYYPIMYLPQAIGITIARIFHGNINCLFYLGRLCNLMFFVACMYIAMRKIPILKMALFVIGMFPMTIQQAASMSYDSFINGMSFILIAYLIAAIYEKGQLSQKEYICIAVTTVLLAPAKSVYSLVFILAFLIPKERFKSNKDYWIKMVAIIGIMLMVLGVVSLSQVSNVVNTSNRVSWDGGKTYSLAFIFENPVQTIKIFLMTLRRFLGEWFFELVGYRLSGLSLKLNEGLIVAYLAIIVLASIRNREQQLILEKKNQALNIIVICGIGVAVMLSMFLAWTSNTMPVILGVQGRYFIPIVPLVCCLINNNYITLEKNIDKFLIIMSVILQIACIQQILVYTITV